MINTIDGALFRQMIVNGARAINIQKQHVNDLNVFPVPDGDTGTNMSLTINTAAAELQKRMPATVGEAASVNASAFLRGARGNSGVILSLLFRGFGKALKDLEQADGRALAAALGEGVAAAYKAVMKPAEGTILTVSRQCARRAAETAAERNSAEAVLEAAIAEGEVALANTVNQNPVLKKAGVIDAGGEGFLIILRGMLAAMRGEELPEEAEEMSVTKEKADFGAFSNEEITFGYCTEFIVSRETKKDPDALRAFLSDLGDSLVVVDDEEIIKVHVHTDHPGKALEQALTYGSLLTVKIENMREQHTEIMNQPPAAQPEPPRHAEPERAFGFVAVCAGEGLSAIFRDLGADGVISGGQTMNPSTEDILREIDATPAEVVFVLPNNKNIIMTAEQCVSLVPNKKVVVLPTKSVPQGIAALLAVEPERDEQGNTAAMNEAIARVSTAEITYAARDSDFDGHTIKQGDYMALADRKLFAVGPDLTALLGELAQSDVHQCAEFITIFYGEDVAESDAEVALTLFEAACPNAEVSLLSGGQPVYYFTISAE